MLHPFFHRFRENSCNCLPQRGHDYLQYFAVTQEKESKNIFMTEKTIFTVTVDAKTTSVGERKVKSPFTIIKISADSAESW